MDTSPGASSGGVAAGGVVRLNIGGHKFITTAGTLTRNGTEDNYFARLLSGRMPLAYLPSMAGRNHHAEGQWLFIDRNGRYFEPILDFLRTGEWMVPRGVDERLVMREAEFYCVQLPRFGDLAVSNVALHNQAAAYGVILNKVPRLVRYIERLVLETLTQEMASLEMPATPWISVWPRSIFVSHRHPGVLGVEPQIKLGFKDLMYFDPTCVVDSEDEGIGSHKDKPLLNWEIPNFAAAMVWHMRERHRLTVTAEWASFQAEYQPTGLTPGYVRQGSTAPLLQFRWCPPSGSSLWIPPPSLTLS